MIMIESSSRSRAGVIQEKETIQGGVVHIVKVCVVRFIS